MNKKPANVTPLHSQRGATTVPCGHGMNASPSQGNTAGGNRLKDYIAEDGTLTVAVPADAPILSTAVAQLLVRLIRNVASEVDLRDECNSDSDDNTMKRAA